MGPDSTAHHSSISIIEGRSGGVNPFGTDFHKSEFFLRDGSEKTLCALQALRWLFDQPGRRGNTGFYLSYSRLTAQGAATGQHSRVPEVDVQAD